MILVSFQHSLNTVSLCRIPFWKIRGMFFFIESQLHFSTHTMRFKVSFINNIQAIFIAEFIQIRIMRIMTHTDTIYIILLHHCHIFSHQFLTRNVSVYRIMLVNIYPLNQDWITINKQLGIFNFNSSESRFPIDIVMISAILPFNCIVVKFRGFRTPLYNVCYINLKIGCCILRF